MILERKRAALPLLLMLVVLTSGVACKKKQPQLPQPETPPTTTVVPPTTDVPATPALDTGDATEPERPRSLEELEEDARQSGLLGDVYFAFDRYDLESEARERLARNAEYMNSNPELTFTIEGHADERGTNEYNLALAQRRAAASLDYLMSLGVDRGRVKTISYGEERPFCTESTEACWQKNRRAHFVLSGRR